MSEKKVIEIAIIQGVEGQSLYINDFRIAGNKPWGDGHVVKTWTVKKEDLLEDIKKALE